MSGITASLDPAGIFQPIAALLDRHLYRSAEAAIAVLTLWLVSLVERGQINPQEADDALTRLDVYLTDRKDSPPLSPALQELLFEGGCSIMPATRKALTSTT